jgi:hypothetical protein
MADASTRLGLPFIVAGQAQKEISHNEALMLLDFIVQPVVVAVGVNAPPTAPLVGQSWIIGPSPSGVWVGNASHIANWSEGGWRFVVPANGMQCWSVADEMPVRFASGSWVLGLLTAAKVQIGGNQIIGARQTAISTPTGGTTVDAESRVAITEILAAMRTHGLISA